MSAQGPATTDPLAAEALLATLRRLEAEQRIESAAAECLVAELPEIRERSAYTLRHLGGLLGIGALRYSLVAFLPVGSMLRFLWVATWRIIETVRGRRERARVHSFAVMGVALIPFLGYAAYVLPLRASHPRAPWLYANHVFLLRRGTTLDAWLEGKPRLVRRLVGWMTATRSA